MFRLSPPRVIDDDDYNNNSKKGEKWMIAVREVITIWRRSSLEEKAKDNDRWK